uniref:Leucine-rich repeat protein (LRRP) n=1 Tax=Trypanosoma congolense (strain IL3000) TaxID=1068625 RepID=G0UL43_TRYCI|nr:conserved hypothetical protein [Trypanosoma congolense IL3000]
MWLMGVHVPKYIRNDHGTAYQLRVGILAPGKFHMHDPVYRIMHMTPRSDVLEVVKCRFGSEECQRAATYFDSSYTKNPLRYLRLQIGCDRATGFNLFFPRLQHHRATLRLLDLSRNCLDEEDVATLVNLLNLRNDDKCESLSVLEVLDLSYNRRIGNSGGVMLLGALHGNDHIRAVVLKGISLTDAGATSIASLLQQRPKPRTCVGECMHSCEALHNGHAAGGSMFFLNLNENLIGSKGIHALGKGIPSYVSLTACKQHPLTSRNRSLASTL